MKFQKICLANYGPFFGEHTFSFSRKGLVLICGRNLDDPRCDSNGAGKSSLFDALDWALFGKVPRGDHVDSVIHDCATSCQVRVELEDDGGRPIVIERRRGKESSLRFWVAGEDRQALDVRETQKHIEKVLGVDRDTFHAAVYFGQTDLIRYADSTDAERMEVLTRILQLEEIDGLLERTKGLLQALSDQEAASRERLARLSAEEGVLRSQNLVDKSAEWEGRRQADVQGWAADHSRRTNDLLATEMRVRELYPAAQAEAERLAAEMDALAAPPVLVSDANKRLASAQEVCGVARYRMTEAQRVLSIFQPLGETCSVCGQPVPEALRSGERQKRELALAQATAEYQQAEQVMRAAQAEVNHEEMVRARENAALVQRRLQLRQQAEGAQRAVLQHEQTFRAVEAGRLALAQLWEQIQRRAMEVNPFASQIEQTAMRLAEIGETLAREGAWVEGAKRRRNFLEFWKDAFGPHGLKSYILDARLHDLTEAANRWVQQLTGGVYWVQFQSQRQTRGKKIVNAPEVRVARWQPDGTITERNYRSLSGGEKQRVSFPIDFGLSHLLASRSRQRYDLLLLDEVFRHLDRTGKEAMVEMLELLAREKGAVYVIEHDAEMQGLFEQRVVVEKKNRCSVIREETSHGQHAKEEKPITAALEHSVPSGAIGQPPIHRPVQRTPVPR
jgi:DNA repair exonuclease SbcCD ATPase subunit